MLKIFHSCSKSNCERNTK